ncbi:MAG: hypothetical protein NVSMB3_08780 [Acidobacteriaceae bacterium]
MTTRKANQPGTPAPTASATSPPPSASPSDPPFEITFRGTEAAVRSAVHNARFDSPWDIGLARAIALDQTLVADAILDDTLDNQKIRMFAQDDRDLYRDRCCQAADKLGHPVPLRKQSLIHVDAGATIRDVAQALYDTAS